MKELLITLFRRNKVLIIMFISLSMIATDAFAFKINTHIWVGNEVLKDLQPDGKVSIPPYGEFEVSKDVYDALINNQDIYRMGNAAPDGLPDLMAGQMLVHPGIEGDWVTDDWLKWVMKKGLAETPQTKAFSYGYISHAAADVFSHTYVNMYSGDIYLLTDGLEEEWRHLALEGYIVNHTPPLTDYKGNPIGECHEVISAPTDFISRTLLRNSTVKSHHMASFSTYHLSGMYKLEELQNDAIDRIETANKLLSGMPEGIPFYKKKIDENAKKLSAAEEELRKLILDRDRIDKALKKQEQLIDAQQSVVSASAERLNALNNKIGSLNSQISAKTNELAEVPQYLTRIITKALACVWYPCPTWRKPHKTCKKCPVEKVTDRYVNPAWERLNNTINSYVSQKAEALRSYTSEQAINSAEAVTLAALELDKTRLQAERSATLNSISAINNTISTLNATALNLNKALNKLMEYALVFDNARSAINNWRKDVIEADEKYIAANADFIKAIVNKQNSDKIKPLTDWMGRYMPVYAGVPSDVIGAMNKVFATMEKVTALVDKINPLKDVMESIKKETKELAVNMAKNVAGEQTKQLISMMSDKSKEDQKKNLIDIFSADSSSKNLLLIPDIAERLDNDMHLDANGNFNPMLFRPAYNAVTLAKMALLDAKNLNLLVERAKALHPEVAILSGKYGDDVLFPEDKPDFNVLFDWICSIDGNHQWQHKSVPIPRKNDLGNPDYSVILGDKTKYYGYAFDPETKSGGLRIWQEDGARKCIFNVIFHGPLNESLESPMLTGISEVIGSQYSWRGTSENPFPRSDEPSTTAFYRNAYLVGTIEALMAADETSVSQMTADEASASQARNDNESDDKKNPNVLSCGSNANASTGIGLSSSMVDISVLAFFAIPFAIFLLRRRCKSRV